jgi:hypothetical protein
VGAPDLLQVLQAKGFSVYATESGLMVTPARLITDSIRETVRNGKESVLLALELKRLALAYCDQTGHHENPGALVDDLLALSDEDKHRHIEYFKSWFLKARMAI